MVSPLAVSFSPKVPSLLKSMLSVAVTPVGRVVGKVYVAPRVADTLRAVPRSVLI